jgi:DNA-binding LacI/PurR family transcriptional regulator
MSGEPPTRPPTMADIADHLGISRQLVSLVLREQPGASAETRERVLAAVTRLGYRPHVGAQVLRRSESRHLGVVFAPAHATEPEIVESIYRAAADRGHPVVLSATTPTRTSQTAVEELLGYRCAALVVIGAEVGGAALAALARRAAVPLVAVGAGRRNSAYDVVRSAGDDGIAACVEHLTGFGHRRISYVHGLSMPSAPLRLAGYRRAMDRLGLVTDVLELSGDYTEECGTSAARALLARPDLPTAVVACNDQAAVGVILTLARAGVSVPGQVSVTGFDDSRFARLSGVDLTTVRQDPSELGRAAVEAALRRVADPGRRPQERVITPALVVRGSTAAPR